MDAEKNLSLSGNGSVAGGQYNKVQINGSGKVHGDLMCRSIEINGYGRISGAAKAAQVTINGSAVIDQQLSAESVIINGSCKVEGDVHGERIQIDGRTKVLGAMRGDYVRSSGLLSVEKNLESEELAVTGPLKVGGLCSADRIEMGLSGMTSRIKEIGCGTLTVRRQTASTLFASLLGALGKRKLIVDSIEGDDIYLEDTEAKVVRGDRVKIGPGCMIGRVIYRSDYQKDDKAEVQTSLNM
ncbi:polymer-forming cytoskeletal protein [Sporolactobacillus inulinus]|uniref:Polymer-forming cytoskeletal protein n=2 Tax=Sporolactobacillus inulinus TaxID=2078 RepID=A0A4Y1Z922_9BACL|nr:polymer-forming cytoskeletal protein [Sporolactobacillus inulinus]KLI03889.1 hypothetical protein SINU_00570 [Sporolactobacillus inulinus CASD]GAY75500.1 hypothetical protein NBRC111894_1054 [Sporolactobacillus inulinus]GEB78232.1 hypothetical protein SIN01_25770 [Sporolactobacillus inulinus]